MRTQKLTKKERIELLKHMSEAFFDSIYHAEKRTGLTFKELKEIKHTMDLCLDFLERRIAFIPEAELMKQILNRSIAKISEAGIIEDWSFLKLPVSKKKKARCASNPTTS